MLPLNLGIRAHDISAASREELGEKLVTNGFSYPISGKNPFPLHCPV